MAEYSGNYDVHNHVDENHLQASGPTAIGDEWVAYRQEN